MIEKTNCSDADKARGRSDCKKGVCHAPGQSQAYDEGYAQQYENEQILTARSDQNECLP